MKLATDSKQTNRWMSGKMDEWMDGWINGSSLMKHAWFARSLL